MRLVANLFKIIFSIRWFTRLVANLFKIIFSIRWFMRLVANLFKIIFSIRWFMHLVANLFKIIFSMMQKLNKYPKRESPRIAYSFNFYMFRCTYYHGWYCDPRIAYSFNFYIFDTPTIMGDIVIPISHTHLIYMYFASGAEIIY